MQSADHRMLPITQVLKENEQSCSTLADHERPTQGIECRKDADVIDETPMACKRIGAVMASPADLVEVVHALRQVVCAKG